MSESMTSLERTLLTLDGKLPDRVPVDLHNFQMTARLMGATSFADFYRDGDAMAEGQIKAWERFGHDVLIVENGTAALAEACGVHVIYQDDAAPVAKEPAIKSLDDVDSLEVPDPYKVPVLAENLKATRRVVEAIGDRAFIIGRGDQGPFSLASEIRGMSDFMVDLALGEQPEKIHRLLDFCREVAYRYMLAQIEQGAHCTSIGDSPSGPDVISPRFYREYAYPHVKRLVDDLKAQGVRVAYHICGNSTPIIEEMVSTGATIVEIDQKADLRLSKAAAQGKTTLLGPVDPSGVLANGTPDDVMAKAREAIEILAPGGGFILGPGCALPDTTPDENIDALIDAAKRYGRYDRR
ncbi:uroporphyrinogen decarboxylase family protein [Aggregatilinea lenta]|uniref:uroporphyrinogen decarboxylase family protein n=1 Tax=Aggregatilinea lenta TaxID=913108 RepID=UPI000E5BADD9|nr:uroporphyrinogen decarboxylase family protein [Aggregatilinea lenta]